MRRMASTEQRPGGIRLSSNGNGSQVPCRRPRLLLRQWQAKIHRPSTGSDAHQESRCRKAAPHPLVVTLELAVVRERLPVRVKPAHDRHAIVRGERIARTGDGISDLAIFAPEGFDAGADRPEAPKITAVLHNPVPSATKEALR